MSAMGSSLIIYSIFKIRPDKRQSYDRIMLVLSVFDIYISIMYIFICNVINVDVYDIMITAGEPHRDKLLALRKLHPRNRQKQFDVRFATRFAVCTHEDPGKKMYILFSAHNS